jgi:geranylgeranyl pyrophosphate synthase/predicted secreted hydrolase
VDTSPVSSTSTPALGLQPDLELGLQPDPRLERELPHLDHPVEWWFFQGGYSTSDGKQYEFMVSFFRLDVSLENEPARTGYCLLVTLLDVATGKNHVLSQVDDSLVGGLLARIEKLGETEVDKELAQLLFKELKRHGPPRPIKLGDGSAAILPDPLTISWGDLVVRQVDDGFSVAFDTPDLGPHVSLFMQPEYPRILWESAEKNSSSNSQMTYATYPRMTLTGSAGGQKVEGIAWCDHQWGDYCWLVADDPGKQLRGWDWFGINLADGTDIAVSVVRLVRTGEVVFSRALLRTARGERADCQEVQITPLRYWESPLTHIKYPVACRIRISELDFDAVFEPLADDQEIVTIGASRGIWEGAGTIAGRMKGAEISGRARGEFCGYGYLFDFQHYVQTLADRVDKRIEEFLPKRFGEAEVEKFVGKAYWRHEPEALTNLLATPVWDLISRTGKRWRPIFGILMVEALGCASGNYEASACLAELVHSGALIIDDIEDDSLLRRGEPCIHLKYGVDVAINAGNTLYFLPSVELLNHKYLSDAKKLRIHEIMMQTYLEAHFGQTVDIYWSRYLAPDTLELWLEEPLEEKILQLYDYKTASGARGLAEAAVVIAEVDDSLRQVCVDYARSFGVAFQIIDDVHNFSDSPRWTKVCGEDIASGKLTYVIVRAIRKLDGAKRSRLMSILCSPELRKEQLTLQEGVELVRESGALEECRETAKNMSLDAIERFGETIPSCEPKVMLNMLCLKMLDLVYDT